MNIQQMQYVLAVAEQRHYEQAAEKCFVTQSTLSTMISRFEDEIGIKIFDRRKKPVELTTEGQALVVQMRVIMSDIDQLKELTKELKGEISGNLTLSVIPTVAPFLLPLFLQDFATKFPQLHITVKEETTGEIMRKLKSRDLDIGIASIPLDDRELQEIKLYDEPFVFYDAAGKPKKETNIGSLDAGKLCLLEEGHCMRTQVLKLCDIKKNKNKSSTLNFDYKAGSIDSLLRFVKSNKATTLLPQLCTVGMPASENKHISKFASPVPYRSVGIVVHQHFVKRKILDILKNEIEEKVRMVMPETKFKGEQINPM